MATAFEAKVHGMPQILPVAHKAGEMGARPKQSSNVSRRTLRHFRIHRILSFFFPIVANQSTCYFLRVHAFFAFLSFPATSIRVLETRERERGKGRERPQRRAGRVGIEQSRGVKYAPLMKLQYLPRPNYRTVE